MSITVGLIMLLSAAVCRNFECKVAVCSQLPRAPNYRIVR